MSGYIANIEEKTQANNYFREVLFMAPHCQLVVMSLNLGEDIGEETHYAPVEHRDGTVHKTKVEALNDKEDYV